MLRSDMDAVTYTLLFASLYFEVFLLVSFLEKRAFGIRKSHPVKDRVRFADEG